jgi:nucleoside-diphosphate-sugar epimerase
MLSGRTVLLTGSTGRLGAELTRRAEELGAAVLPLVYGGYPDSPKRIPWAARAAPRRVRRREDLDGLPRPDLVINAHWEVSRTLPFADQLAFEIDANIRALAGLWDWLSAAGVRSFVNISSIKIFGPSHDQPITAATEPRPASPYGIAKFAAEKFFDAAFGGRGPVVTHLRLAPLMAAGGHPSQLTSQILAGLFEGRRILVNAGHRTHLLPIEEAADLVLAAGAEARGGRFNIVPPGLANEEIAELFGRIAGRRIEAEFRDLEPGAADPVFISDIEAFGADWVRRRPIEEAIRRVLGKRP